nr:alpha/beta hydrolase [Patulibacter sp. SYSU D01012]
MAAFSATTRPPAGVATAREELGGRPALRLTPAVGRHDGPAAVLLLHGGAYTTGSATTHRAFAGRLAAAAGAPVHLLEYRLAPEHPYPAALDDAAAAFAALAERAGGADRTWLVGDSAGAGLAVALCARLHEADRPGPAALGLVCPWLDTTLSAASVRRNRRREPLLRAAWLRRSAAAYRGGAAMPEALWAPPDALPPVVLHGAGDDLLVDDADRLAARLARAGRPCTYARFDGRPHDFHLFAGTTHDADAAVDRLARELRAAAP